MQEAGEETRLSVRDREAHGCVTVEDADPTHSTQSNFREMTGNGGVGHERRLSALVCGTSIDPSPLSRSHMIESHAVFLAQAYAISCLFGTISPLLHAAALFTLLCFVAHPRSSFAHQTLWSTKDFVKLLFSGHHAHSMVMHVVILTWHYVGTVTLMLATGLPFETIWRVDLALDTLVFVKHFAVQLYTCFEYRRFISQNYGDLGRHLAFVICASMPGRILRCFARTPACRKPSWRCRRLARPPGTATGQGNRSDPRRHRYSRWCCPRPGANDAHSSLSTRRLALRRGALLALRASMAPCVSTLVDMHAVPQPRRHYGVPVTASCEPCGPPAWGSLGRGHVWRVRLGMS